MVHQQLRSLDQILCDEFGKLNEGNSMSTEDKWRICSSKIHSLITKYQHEILNDKARLQEIKGQYFDLLEPAFISTKAKIDEIMELSEISEEILRELETHEYQLGHLVTKVSPLTEQLRVFERKRDYIKTAMGIEELCENIRYEIEGNGDFNNGIKNFQKLINMSLNLHPSYCELNQLVQKRSEYFSNSFKNWGSKRLKEALKNIDWPSIKSKEEVSNMLQKENEKFIALSEFQISFESLLKLQISVSRSNQIDNGDNTLDIEDQLICLWAVDCLMNPLIRRFRYHFQGNKRTNRLDKPEQFLNNILRIVWDHSPFLNIVVQPLLQKHHIYQGDIMCRVIRGLIFTAMQKLEDDMGALIQNDSLFCNTIDKILKFECALDEDYEYHSLIKMNTNSVTYWPRLLDVIVGSNERLEKWICVEWKYSMHQLRQAVESEIAWFFPLDSIDKQHSHSFINWIDWEEQDLHTTTSALQFLSLLDTLKQRFEILSDTEQKLIFVSNLQKPLLQQYYLAVGKMARKQKVFSSICYPTTKEWKLFCGCLNSCQYIVESLEQFITEGVYVDLQHYAMSDSRNKSLSNSVSNLAKKTLTSALSTFRDHSKAAQDLSTKKLSSVIQTVANAKETAAVKHAVLGPNAMIGPTAAISAALSTVRSVMEGVQDHKVEEEQDSPNDDEDIDENESTGNKSNPVAASILSLEKCLVNVAEEMIEDDVFDEIEGGLFDREIQMYKALVDAMVGDAVEATISCFLLNTGQPYRHCVVNYTSLQAEDTIRHDVTAILAKGIELLYNQLASAKKNLSGILFQQYWKGIANKLDDYIYESIFTSIYFRRNRSDSTIHESHRDYHFVLSGAKQFVYDMKAIEKIFSMFTIKAARYLPKIHQVCLTLEMDTKNRLVLKQALKGLDHSQNEHNNDEYELAQLSTMLEQYNVYNLRPIDVLQILELLQY